MSRISALWMWPHTTPSKPRLRASVRQRRLEFADVAHGVLHLVLEELRERPVRQPQARAGVVEPAGSRLSVSM